MKKPPFLLLLCTPMLLAAGGAAAQFTFDHSNYRKGAGFVTDVTGRPADPRAYERVTDGSPWWFDQFLTADLAGQDGRMYSNIAVKVDLLADKVFYREPGGATLELLTPIWYLNAFASGSADTLQLLRAGWFKGAATAGIGGWLQRYIAGEATLLRQLGKQMQENPGFSSASPTVSVVNRYQWVLLLEGEMIPVKKVKDLQQLLGQRKPALLQYSGKQKGFDAQVQELVLAYNRM